MNRSDFIEALAADLVPVSPSKIRSDLLLAVGSGVMVTSAAVVLHFGVQPGLLSSPQGLPLIVKSAYGLALAGVAAAVLWPLLRPGQALGRAWLLTAVPVLMLTGLTLFQTMRAPGEGAAAFLGHSWKWCPLRVVGLSAPIFAALCWAIRRQAPTQFRAAGAAAGLLAGGLSATIYALACTEPAAGFVLIWYSAGIAACTAIGAAIGPRLLRW